MSGAKKLWSSLLVLGIGLGTMAIPPIVQPTRAQTQPQEQEILNLLHQAFQLTKRGQPWQAIATFQQVITLAKQAQDKGTEALALVGIGLTYYNNGQPQQALESLHASLPLYQAVRDGSGFATALNNIGEVYRSIGQPQKALEYYDASLPISKKIGDRDLEATTLNNIGLAYFNTGQPQKALKYYGAALPISKETGNRSLEASLLNNTGEVYRVIGQAQKALEYYNACLPILQAVGDRANYAATLSNIGIVYNNIGQPQKSLAFYNDALPIYRELGDKSGEATTLNNVGLVYYSIGQYKKSLEYYSTALPILQKVGNRPIEATTLNNIGSAYRSLGQHKQALEFLAVSLPILKEVGNRSGVATTLNNIGELYASIGEPQTALEYFNASLPVLKESGNRSVEATNLNNIGSVYSSLGQPQKALEYYNTSLPIHKEVGNLFGEANTLSNIGSVYRNSKIPKEAIANFEKSVEITLQLRSGLARSNRQQFLTSNRSTSISLIDLLIAQKQPERAYQWVNLTTTADLADYSRLIEAKVANVQAQQAIAKWNQSNRQLESLRQQLQEKFSPQRSQQIDKLQAQVNQQAETISRQYPEIAELFETTPTDIAKLRANIPQGTVIVQPVLLTNVETVPDAIALFVITSGKLTVTQQKIDSQAFDALVTQYRRELTDGRFKRYRTTSAKLYDILIRPIEAQLQANGAKQLSIIATGKLRYIPFETLIDSKTNKYLIEKYPVNNLTRLSTRILPSNKHKAKLLALGNPFPDDGRSLQGAESEIKSIAPILPGSETHLGANAKLDTFRTQSPRFPILHLATHGCFTPSGCPELKLEPNTILFSDRNLNIADAALLGLKNTDLVVLSACQTAVQANSNGEEFAGMAYLFERAGAKSVIASLWLAKDEETRDLMIKFYQNLKQGMTKGEALRQAKLSLIDKHPLYWSPFILIGDAR